MKNIKQKLGETNIGKRNKGKNSVFLFASNQNEKFDTK
jgi:hypothetical protein